MKDNSLNNTDNQSQENNKENKYQFVDEYIGKIIDSKYEVLELLIQCGSYNRYLVADINVNKIWVMMVYDKNVPYYCPAMRARILAESCMMQKLNHSSIPKIVDIIENEDNIFIVRDCIEGETLDIILRKDGAQPVDKVIEWGKQICSALGYLHLQNPPLIFRNMDLTNVMLTQDGTMMLVDFASMREYKPNKNRDIECIITKYAAPEQWRGHQIDARTDIYGLGMTMYRLVTGVNPAQLPYDIKPICMINPNLPKGLEYIISKCIQQKPNDRYQSCEELMNDLNNYLELPKSKGILGKLFGKK